ncbi:33924_t:CDS:1, partial [Racocetra persica]
QSGGRTLKMSALMRKFPVESGNRIPPVKLQMKRTIDNAPARGSLNSEDFINIFDE